MESGFPHKLWVMMFGLTNSPAMFQTMMNNIFQDLIDQGVVLVYLDDILIYTGTMEEHQWVMQQVLEILWMQKLYLCSNKCEVKKKKIEYLGLVISNWHLEMDLVKVAGVHNWP